MVAMVEGRTFCTINRRAHDKIGAYKIENLG